MIALALLGCVDDATAPTPAPTPSPAPAEAPTPTPGGLPAELVEYVPTNPPFEVVGSAEGRASLRYTVSSDDVLTAFAARNQGAVLQQAGGRLLLARWSVGDGRPTLGTVEVRATDAGLVEVALDAPLSGSTLPTSERCGANRIEVTTGWPAGGTATACVDPATGHLDGPFALEGDGVRVEGGYLDGHRAGDWTSARDGAVVARGRFDADRPSGTWTLPSGAVTFGPDGRPVGVAATVLEDGAGGLSVVGAKLEAGEVVLRGWVVAADGKECRYPGAPDPRAFGRIAVLKAGGGAPAQVQDLGRASTESVACSTAAELAADHAAAESLLTTHGVDPLAPVSPVALVVGAPAVTVSGHAVALEGEPASTGPASLLDDPDLLGRPFTWSPREQWPAVVLRVDGKPAERIFTRATSTRAELVVDGARYAVVYDGRLMGQVRTW